MANRILSRLASATELAADLTALAVIGVFWIVTGAWRAIPRHNEEACWDCQHGAAHDTNAIVL